MEAWYWMCQVAVDDLVLLVAALPYAVTYNAQHMLQSLVTMTTQNLMLHAIFMRVLQGRAAAC